MNKIQKILLVFVAYILWMSTIGIVYAVAKNTDNDVVLHQKEYTEYFKQEGSNKNYIYIRTTQDAPPPGKCYVYTGASETAISVVCNTNPS